MRYRVQFVHKISPRDTDEGEKVIAFPDRGIWHSLIITPKEASR